MAASADGTLSRYGSFSRLRAGAPCRYGGHMHQPGDGKAKPTKLRNTPTTGHVDDDGTLVELLYDLAKRQTALAIWREGKWTIEQAITLPSGERLAPYSPGNALIRHQVVVLPSEPAEYGSPAAPQIGRAAGRDRGWQYG